MPLSDFIPEGLTLPYIDSRKAMLMKSLREAAADPGGWLRTATSFGGRIVDGELVQDSPANMSPEEKHEMVQNIALNAGGLGTMVGATERQIAQHAAAEKSGLSRDQIWQQHGTTRIPGGGIGTEIPDQSAKLTLPPGKYAGTNLLSNIYQHPELYDKYPGLKNTEVNWRISPHVSGGYHYNPLGPLGESTVELAGPADTLKSSLVHELQHGIQYEEGWPLGTNPNYQDAIMGNLKPLEKKVTTIAEGYRDDPHALENLRRMYANALGSGESEDLAMQIYLHHAGEAQSRMAEARLKVPEELLRVLHPEGNYDVPTKSLIYDYGQPSAASVPGAKPLLDVRNQTMLGQKSLLEELQSQGVNVSKSYTHDGHIEFASAADRAKADAYLAEKQALSEKAAAALTSRAADPLAGQ